METMRLRHLRKVFQGEKLTEKEGREFDEDMAAIRAEEEPSAATIAWLHRYMTRNLSAVIHDVAPTKKDAKRFLKEFAGAYPEIIEWFNGFERP